MSGTARPNDRAPRRNFNCFRCPYCEAVAKQDWLTLFYAPEPNAGHQEFACHAGQVAASRCQSCTKMAIWVGLQMVYPQTSTAPMPAADMPEDAKTDYLEARKVFDLSPRAAGGLLRLAFEKVLAHLGMTGGNPNEAIGELVKSGLAPEVQQQALDVMRVYSNQAVHHGFVRLEDQPATVSFLFWLLNYIVEERIAKPKAIRGFYAAMPQDKRDAITRRDERK
jgi:hypothetical protein